MKKIVFTLSLLSILTLIQTSVVAESRWEPNIRKFEERDKLNPPKEGGIVFVGSSSMVMWKTDKDFPDLKIINRGFGGSQTKDSVEFAERIVIKYKPRIVALYAGDNDIAAGKSPDEVVADTKKFFALIHDALPETRIIYVAIKPSLARWKLVDKMREANAKIRAITEKDDRMTFCDIDTPMMGKDGKPRGELFIQDGLHLSREGYDLWNNIIEPMLTDKD